MSRPCRSKALPASPGRSELAPLAFPRASEGDPEGQQDQPDVEPKALAANVQQVVFEFVSARNVARRVDLRDPGKSRPHETHLALPDVEQLRDLIERGRTEQSAYASDARVMNSCLDGDASGIRV